MYWNRIESNWSQFKGIVKERWARLDDEQLLHINGRRDLLLQSIGASYDVTAEEAEKEVSEWQRFQKLKPRSAAPASPQREPEPTFRVT